jgi:hypothetical protein
MESSVDFYMEFSVIPFIQKCAQANCDLPSTDPHIGTEITIVLDGQPAKKAEDTTQLFRHLFPLLFNLPVKENHHEILRCK